MLNEAAVKQIQIWVEDAQKLDPLLLVGKAGIGKKTACRAVLKESNCITVEVRSNEFFQMADLIRACTASKGDDPNTILAVNDPALYLATLIASMNTCLSHHFFMYFDKMEACDEQHALVMRNLITYCKTNGIACNFALAFEDKNYLRNFMSLNNAPIVVFKKASIDTIQAIIQKRIQVEGGSNVAVARKIATMSDGNIGICEAILSTLVKLDILVDYPDGLTLISNEDLRRIPGSLTELYAMQLSSMGESWIDALSLALPFKGDIHVSAIAQTGRLNNPGRLYYNISKNSNFLVHNHSTNSSRLFDRTYSVASASAEYAITDLRNCEVEIQYFREHLVDPILNQKKQEFEGLSFADQYELLVWASGLNIARPDAIAVGRLVELLFLSGYYVRICELIEQYLGCKSGNGIQWLSKRSPTAFELYLESLYNLGRYREVIRQMNLANEPTARCLLTCAKAHYAINQLEEAKSLAMTALKYPKEEAEAFMLLASIENWKNNTKGQVTYMTRAVKALANAPAFQGTVDVKFRSIAEMRIHQSQLELRKRYALMMKGRTGAITKEVRALCHDIMEKRRLDYPAFSRTCAELLHNYGTDLIKDVKTRVEGLSYLYAADEYFASMCDQDRYYVKNSIAMACCFSGQYALACEQFSKLEPPVHLPFCVMAVRNNEWMAARQSGNSHSCKTARAAAEAMIRSLFRSKEIEGDISKDTLLALGIVMPDVKLQLRHYCINCALDESEHTQAYNWLKAAQGISQGVSSSTYLMNNLLNKYKNTPETPKVLKMGRNAFEHVKPVNKPAYGTIDYWFAEESVFFCEIMFWG